MQLDNNMKITIIGLGNLAEYMRPCYERLLGENMKTNVIAIKASERNLEEKRRAFGFEISVGNTLEVLKRQRPDMIFLSPPPKEVPPTTQNVLAPYYAFLREQHQELPLLLNFAPDPPAAYFYVTLGQDILAVNILPNMLCEIEGIDCSGIGLNFVTFDARHKWQGEPLEFLKRFLAPVGGFLDSPQEMVQELLSTKVVGNPVFDMCCQIADILKERGVTLAESAIASCMRAAHRAQFDDLTPDSYHCSTQDVPEEYRPFVEQAILSWYGGLLDYARSVGVQPPVDKQATRFKIDLQLLAIQLQPRQAIEHTHSTHATKGGVLEHGTILYNTLCRDKFNQAFEAYLSTHAIDESFFAFWREQAKQNAQSVTAHCRKLSK